MKHDYFALRRPCDQCPFSTGPDAVRTSRERVLEILDDQNAFPCHKTIDYDAQEENPDKPPDDYRVCAGFLWLQKQEGHPAAMVQIALRLGIYDPDKLEPVNVFDNRQAAIAAHEAANR